MAAITSQNLANAIVKLVAADALPALMGNLIMGNLVNRDYDGGGVYGVGDTVNVPLPAAMTANNLAEAGSVSTQNPSLGSAAIVLNTHAEASFSIPDVTRVIATPSLLENYMQPAIAAVAERIETDLLSLYAQFTANASVGTSNTAITEAVLDSAETALFTAKVPPGPKNLILSGTAYGAVRQIARFTEAQTVGNGNALATGVVGTIKDLSVYRSQFVPKVSNTTYNLAFHKNALALVTRNLPSPLPGTGAIAETVNVGNFGLRVIMSYNPTTLSQQFTVDTLYGVGVLRPDHAIVVLS